MIESNKEAEIIDLTDHPRGSAAERPVLAGRYRLDRRIAEGGFGIVYRATQLNLDRPVAVKVISTPEDERDEESAKERFMLEAATLAKLVHPNVVTIHDYGRTDAGELFIVMEYLDGQHLDYIVQHEGPLPFRRIVRIAVQIARALRAAHASNVVHRDLKPANVMLVGGQEENDADQAKVLDFGLVKLMDGRSGGPDDLTESTSLLGTPKYMAPEQICGEVTDARTDIYSLGCVLYFMASGVPPFDEETKFGIVQAHLTRVPAPTGESGYRRTTPPALESVIMRCLEKTPSERYASAEELITDLKIAYASLPIESAEAIQPLMFDSRDLVDGLGMGIRSEITNSGWVAPELRSQEPPRSPSTSRGIWLAVALLAVALIAGVTLFARDLPQRASEPAAAPPATFGSIRLESTPPGAHVFINGEPTGQLTPSQIEGLPIGTTVEVRLDKKGFAPFVRQIEVRAGGQIAATLTPVIGESEP